MRRFNKISLTTSPSHFETKPISLFSTMPNHDTNQLQKSHFATQVPDLERILSSRQLLVADLETKGLNRFVKGDISGIQEFIFAVKSEGAAKTLKGRSYFIQALSELCLHQIRSSIGSEPLELLYNGGGNFYFFTTKKAVEQFDEVQRVIHRNCAHEEFYLTLTAMPFVAGDLSAFGEKLWKPVNEQSSRDKLRKFYWQSEEQGSKTVTCHTAFDAFSDHADADVEEGEKGEKKWADFTQKFINATGFEVFDNLAKLIQVRPDGVDGFDAALTFGGSTKQFGHGIVNQLPRWDKEDALKSRYNKAIQNYRLYNADSQKPEARGIIEFGYMAAFAAARTGTDKLAVLKMDVDNLGLLFEERDRLEDLQTISKSLTWFFDDFMRHLWEKTTFQHYPEAESGQAQSFFKDNLYVVFSGGDDCFVVGAWDAVFEFVKSVRKEFEAFEKELKKRVPKLPSLTLSASLTVVDPKFPVVRFAEVAEDALKAAKRVVSSSNHCAPVKEKNRINVFGQILRWADFYQAESYAKQLRNLILKDDNPEPRAILERIKNSGHLFEKMQNRLGKKQLASIWRLYYYLRNVKEQNREEMEKIITAYSGSLVIAFAKTPDNAAPPTAHLVYPVAARWAEFLTRM